MKPPRLFKINPKRGYSLCLACGRWRKGNNIFQHEGTHWVLCKNDYEEYWFCTDELLPDYIGYNV